MTEETHQIDVADVIHVERGTRNRVIGYTADGTEIELAVLRSPTAAFELAGKLHRILASYPGFANVSLDELRSALHSTHRY